MYFEVVYSTVKLVSPSHPRCSATGKSANQDTVVTAVMENDDEFGLICAALMGLMESLFDDFAIGIWLRRRCDGFGINQACK